jgi:hypothetical protein
VIEIPQKIVCVGLNYRDHAAEQGVDLLQRPLLFAKWPNTLIANGEPIRIRDVTTQVDYEAELGVVISRTAKDVALEEAFGFVQGYVVANDVSARDLQFADVQWVRGKSLDTFLPVSDLVPAIDVPDPQTLPIRAIRNGETLQDSNTSNMVFSVAEIIVRLARDHTRTRRPDHYRHTRWCRRLPGPADLARARRRNHRRNRRPRLDHQPCRLRPVSEQGFRQFDPSMSLSRLAPTIAGSGLNPACRG